MELLDDPLHGPRARINRAESQLVELHESFKATFEEHPYRIVIAELHAYCEEPRFAVQSGVEGEQDDADGE